MRAALDYPLLVLLVSLAVFCGSAWIGVLLGRTRKGLESDREDFSFLLGGILTLLGLIVGFTFSMAVGRYDQRKNYEEQEANAIGTEYSRADLLPATDAAKVRGLLRAYTDQRILFYTRRDGQQLQRINAETTRLQGEMWRVVTAYASAQPTPVVALIVSGMNDVLNSQGYTQAAWWNRIPTAAWALVFGIAIFCNALIGVLAQGRRITLFLILPIVLSVTLFLVADIDSPGGGVIRIVPQNLGAVVESMRVP
jgi:hypothetical protein